MRTKYFLNITSGSNTLKRLAGNTVEHFSKVAPNDATNVWTPSSYNTGDLKDKFTFRQVTRDEARKLHPAAFRSVRKPTKAPPIGIQLANKYRTAVQGLDIKHSQKIAAIKEIRTIGEFGLAESLTIVENFDKFLAFIEERNELPAVGSRWDTHPFTKKA